VKVGARDAISADWSLSSYALQRGWPKPIHVG